MTRKTLPWILRCIRNRIPALIIMTLAHVASALFGVGLALGSKSVIDHAVAGDMRGFWTACGIQGLLILFLLLCHALARHLREKLRGELDRDWKRRLFHGLLHGDYLTVSGFHSAELMNRLNQDVRIVDDGLLSVLPNGGAMFARLIAAVVALGLLDWRLVTVVAGLAILVFPATVVLRRRMKQLHKNVIQHDGRITGLMQESMEKLLVIQGMELSNEVEHRADAILDERFAAFCLRKNISLAANSAVGFLYHAAGFLALVWCAYGLLTGTMSFGSLTAVTTLISQMSSPLVNLSAVIPQITAMMASAERLMELEEIKPEVPDREICVQTVYAQMDAICGDGLCFSYDKEQVLDNLSFTLKKGEFAIITGQSGIGKSTLLKLMLGIFPPEKGTLYVSCGEKKVQLDRSTRRMFAYVPQGNLLLSGTVRDNLVIAAPQATDEEINKAIFVSGMDEFLEQLPDGLDTLLGESGAGLSEGQIQRLAIARAILSGAPVLLLDECTSALDPQTEYKVLSRIKALPGRSCIAVTHRSAAAQFCDSVIELKTK